MEKGEGMAPSLENQLVVVDAQTFVEGGVHNGKDLCPFIHSPKDTKSGQTPMPMPAVPTAGLLLS